MTAIDDLLKKRNIQYNSPSSSSGGSPIDNLYASLESGTYAEKRKSFFETPAQKDYTGIHADARPTSKTQPKEQKGIFGNIGEIRKDPNRTVLGELGKVKLSNVWNSVKQKSKQVPGQLRSGLGTGLSQGVKATDLYGDMVIWVANKVTGQNVQRQESPLYGAGETMRQIEFEKNRQLEDIYQKTRPESEGIQRNVEDIAGSLPGTGASIGVGIGGSVLGTPALGATLAFGTSYGLSADEVYTEARMQGLSDEEAGKYAGIAAPIVASIDLLPLDELTAGASNRPVKATIQRYILKEMQKTSQQALLEGSTEALQEVVQNAVATMYNENKSLWEGVPESILVGSIVGGMSDVTMSGAQAGYDKATQTTGTTEQETYKYLQKVNENIDKILDTPVKKRTPQEQQIVDDLLTIEITPEMAMSYIVENDLGESKSGQAIIQQVLRAMDMNRTFASELQANLDQAIPAQSNELSSQAVRVNNRFADELNQQLDYQLARPQRQQQYLQNEMNQQLAGLDQSVRLNNTFRNELGNQIDQMYQYPLSGEKGGQVLRRKPVRKQKAIQIKPNEETGQVEIEVVDNKESIAEMMGLVREAISAGDVGAGRAIYEGIVGNKPAFNTIVDEVNYKQKTEENRQKAETNKVIREQFGDETISKINRLKAVARGKDAKAGDIETLRNKDGELTESVIEAVREIPQYENMTDEEALQVALTLPVQADTKAKRVEKPESIKKEKTTDKTIDKSKENESTSKSLKKLEEENSSTLPSIPVENVFKNELGEIKNKRFYDDMIDNVSKLETQKINIFDIVPTQKKLNIENLKKTTNVINSSEEIILINQGGKFYIVDGHHRIANKILQGENNINAKVIPEIKNDIVETNEEIKVTEEPVEIEKVVEKPAQQKPVGTGEKRKSRAYKRVRDLLEADAQLSNVDYNALNLEQDAQNAIDYIARDQDSAMQVALGLKQPPRGQTETAISIALADKLRMEGDHVTASKLEASRSLRQTRRGQEIVSERGRFNDDSPYRYVQELVNRRLYELGGKVSKAKETVSRNNKGVKQDAVNQIDTEAQAIKEILLKKQSKMEKIRQAQKIIDDLKC